MSSIHRFSSSSSGYKRKEDDRYQSYSREALPKYAPYSRSSEAKNGQRGEDLSQKWKRGVSLDEDEKIGYRPFQTYGEVACQRDRADASEARFYIDKMKMESNVEKLKILWQESQKQGVYENYMSVEVYYVNILLNLKAYNLVLSHFNEIPLDSSRIKDVRLFNSIMKGVKHTHLNALEKKFFDQMQEKSFSNSQDCRNSPLFRIYKNFYELHRTGAASANTYQVYMDLVRVNGSFGEGCNVYALADKESKVNSVAKMVYVDCLVGLKKLDEAEAMVEQRLKSQQNEKGILEIDLHDFSHGVGYIQIRKFIKSKEVPNQFHVIHGIGQLEDRNYLVFKNFLKEKFKEDALISSQWFWEDDSTNLGVICLSKRQRELSNAKRTSEMGSSEKKCGPDSLQKEVEKQKLPQFRTVEDLIFAMRNKSS